ncbi:MULTISPECIES: nuclear transport factor 2 family protein [Rhodopseudomonas]|uniref:SnoaL-like domain-containing protein n=2 Tax=Rhodopseudomonas TaxID=1073 RepID=A0A0D7ER95_RHOPL|nr:MULTISPECIES: nuclear transport factor 2 family protein [Rhodopseudomonas]KIZ43303.1 hypothetical protein OO17_11540 [Rhodopseudomonas palustris]
MTTFIVAVALLTNAGTAMAQLIDQPAGGDAFEKVQQQFAVAYNRKDVAAMAAFFSKDGVRITPSGIFRGRDAIAREFQRVVDLGLRDYSVQRQVSRREGDVVFNAGEWRAKLGEQPYRGYYSALLIRNGDSVEIMEETVNVAVAAQ